jgi:hypothetical protein
MNMTQLSEAYIWCIKCVKVQCLLCSKHYILYIIRTALLKLYNLIIMGITVDIQKYFGREMQIFLTLYYILHVLAIEAEGLILNRLIL